MVQGLRARVPAQAEVWVEAKAEEGAEAEWAAHLLPGRGEIVCARAAVKRWRTLSEHRVTDKVVPSAAQ